MEHTTADGSIITILQSVRALTVNEDDEKYYIGTTTAYYNSAIYDYVRLSDACEVLFFKHVTGSEIMLGDVNGDEIDMSKGARNDEDSWLGKLCHFFGA